MYDIIKIRDMQTGGDITYERQKLQLASTPQSLMLVYSKHILFVNTIT